MRMRNEEPWKSVKPTEIALVAATLMRDGTKVEDATRLALQLIECANFGLLGVYQKGRIFDGVDSWVEVQRVRNATLEFEATLPPDWPDPKVETMPFDDATALLMPRQKKVDRLPIFRDWLAASHEIDFIKAGEMIAKLKKTGVSIDLYYYARQSLGYWRERQTSKQRSGAGRKGGSSKKTPDEISI